MDTSTDTGGRLRFGPFELDVRSRELRTGDTCIRLQEQPFESPVHLALARAGLGDADGAFAALEEAVADADPALAYLAVEPRFEPLRADARYGRLLELLCLP